MANTTGIPLRILRDWRDQTVMLSTTLAGIPEHYDLPDEAAQLLTDLSSALDDCAANLASSIATAQD